MTDISRQMRGFYVRCNYLVRNFMPCTDAVKCYLFTSFCANIYAGHCFVNFKQSSLSKITVAFNHSFRHSSSYPRYCRASLMFVSSQVLSFPELLRKCIFNFRQRLLYSTNALIQNIVACFYSSFAWRHWNRALFTFLWQSYFNSMDFCPK